MSLPIFWQAAVATLFATSLFAAWSALVSTRRLAATERAREAVEHRLTQLTYEVRRLDRLVGEAGRRGIAAEPPVSLISVPDLARDAESGDAAGLAEKHAAIRTLMEAGRTSREIADETGRPVGEVELIAGLLRHGRPDLRAGGTP